MKIVYQYSSSGTATRTLVLGDDAERDFIKAYNPGLVLQVQKAGYPRAARMRAFARGNIEHPISWRTSRSRPPYETAMKFIHDHLFTLAQAKSGTLLISQTGGSAFGVNLKGVVLERANVVEQDGAHFVFEYVFWGNELTAQLQT